MSQVLGEKKTGRIVNVGDEVTDFRGDKVIIRYWKEGYHKVVAGGRERYISVFGLEIVDDSLTGIYADVSCLTGETN